MPEAAEHRARGRLQEVVAGQLLRLCAAVTVIVGLGILALLLRGAGSFFGEVGVGEFLFTTRWSPLIEPRSFGVLPLLWGTGMVVVGATALALPLGLASAIYLSEYAAAGRRALIKPALEILAGIPTVVYGYFALTVLTPLLQWLLPGTQVFNAASASIVVGMMTLPMVASLCDDALQNVPDGLREAALALGATRREVALQVVLPAARRGTVAAFVLAVSRAIGETMAVAMAAGAQPNMSLNPLEAHQTMTAFVVGIGFSDAGAGSTAYKSLYAVALTLFVMTLGMNILSQYIMRRYREVYE